MLTAQQPIGDLPKCDDDNAPEWEKEEQSGQEGCQGGCGDRRHDIGREWQAGTCTGEAAAVSSVWLHEGTRPRRLPDLSGHDTKGEAGHDSCEATVPALPTASLE